MGGEVAAFLPAARFVLPLLLTLAAVIDIRQRRIPNYLCLAGLLAGLAAWVWQDGLLGLGVGLMGVLVGGGMFLPFYIARGMGAGDVKLMAAVGSLLGPSHAFYAGLIVFLCGGVIAAFEALRQGRLTAAILDTFRVVLRQKSLRTLGASGREASIPYGLAIAAGVLLYLLIVSYGEA